MSKSNKTVENAVGQIKAHLASMEITGFDPKVLYLALSSVISEINDKRLIEIKKELSMGDLDEANDSKL